MSSKLNNIFSETSCLSTGILADYADDKLSKEERYLVEKHLSDCELCSDALEGLSLVKSKSKLQKILININNSVDARTERKAARLFNFNFRATLAAAAIFISVIGITILFKYILTEQKTDIMAFRTEKESLSTTVDAKSKEKVADSVIAQEQHVNNTVAGDIEQSKSVNDMENEKEEAGEKDIPLVTSKSTISTNGLAGTQQNEVSGYYWKPQNAEDLNKDNNTNSRTIEESSKDSKSPAFADYKSQPVRKIMSDSVSVSDEADQTKNITLLDKTSKELSVNSLAENQTKIKANKKAESKFDGDISQQTTTSAVVFTGSATIIVDQRYASAIRKYDSLDYSGSSFILESYLVSYPNDYNALYYCAASNYFLKQYDNAIEYFKKVVKKKDFAFYEASQWYLALSYIGNKENSNAEKILDEIVADGGSFKTQAEAKLIEIKK